MKFRLVRYKQTSYATYGKLFREDGSQVGVTIERPWVDADRNGKRDRGVSRFVPGTYTCFLRKSHLNGGDGKRDYDVWQLENVPDADACQIHRAAFPADLEGCIGIGGWFEFRGDDPRYPTQKVLAMRGSPETFKAFMAETAGQKTITLEVVDDFR